eukprot:TRINITY_DN72322_c0_g1_i1.p1 TRINITY_DN72322_c0_g1~~TRINITY_DN72322_c0_g1_i1.p1  ORF type:complete len:971 (-),score=203.18 TRINITY_DN72322_c0_g1_i1:120-2927(-)
MAPALHAPVRFYSSTVGSKTIGTVTKVEPAEDGERITVEYDSGDGRTLMKSLLWQNGHAVSLPSHWDTFNDFLRGFSKKEVNALMNASLSLRALRGPNACAPPSPAPLPPLRRGITAGQLADFFVEHCGVLTYGSEEDSLQIACHSTKLVELCAMENQRRQRRRFQPTLRAVSELIVEPHAGSCGTSFVEWLNPEGMPIDYAMCCGEDQDFADLIQGILRHAQREAWKLGKPWRSVSYWCYTFAISSRCPSRAFPDLKLSETMLRTDLFRIVAESSAATGAVFCFDASGLALMQAQVLCELFLAIQSGKQVDFVSGAHGPVRDSARLPFPCEASRMWTSHLFSLAQHINVATALDQEGAEKEHLLQLFLDASSSPDERRSTRTRVQPRSGPKEKASAVLLEVDDVIKRTLAEQAIHTLAWRGEVELLDKALALSVDAEQRDELQITPLTYACIAKRTHQANDGSADPAAPDWNACEVSLLKAPASMVAFTGAMDVLDLFSDNNHLRRQAANRFTCEDLSFHMPMVEVAVREDRRREHARLLLDLSSDSATRVDLARRTMKLENKVHAARAPRVLTEEFSRYLVSEPNATVRLWALRLVRATTQPTDAADFVAPALLRSLAGDADVRLRKLAVQALCGNALFYRNSTASVVPALAKALVEERSADVRSILVESLHRIGKGRLLEHAKPALPALARLLHDLAEAQARRSQLPPAAEPQFLAIARLLSYFASLPEGLGEYSAAVAADLLLLLPKVRGRRLHVLQAVGRIAAREFPGKAAMALAASLVSDLGNDDGFAAAQQLSSLAAYAAPVVPELARALRKDGKKAAAAASALGSLKACPEAREALEAAILEGLPRGGKKAAVRALWKYYSIKVEEFDGSPTKFVDMSDQLMKAKRKAKEARRSERRRLQREAGGVKAASRQPSDARTSSKMSGRRC